MNTIKCCFSLFAIAVLFNCTNESSSTSEGKIDREFRLHAFMTGYVGLDGDIEGVRNPVLYAEKGERVKIVMINGEIMTHDVTMEKAGVKTASIIDKGDSTSVVFEAVEDDMYYCSIPGHRMAGMEGEFKVVEQIPGAVVAIGEIPRIEDKKLNFDFEYNTLEDWDVEGTAFAGQPVSDRSDDEFGSEELVKMQMDGEFFLSSGGTKNYKDTGTIQSIPFVITAPFASFKVSGGALKETRVELVNVQNGEVLFEITGNDQLEMRPVVVDLQGHQGEDIFIRLVDKEVGVSPIPYIRDNKLAHINFDNFRFYKTRPVFSDELKPEDIVILPPRDLVKNAGLSGPEAVTEMELGEEFSIQLAASEPEVVRPIAFTMDHRGRLWVVEAHTYPVPAEEGQGRDRILIFEDTNGDGTLDSRKIFIEGLNLVSGMEVGHGGVWIGAAPYLKYIPIDESGDKPAGEPEILLDGWGTDDTHETLNSFRWGPDGWLYGTQGVFTHSNVGKPGASEDERIKLNACVWRYHPIKHEFEIYARGTSNPWGLDFNPYGHIFITACVIPHLYHVIRGGKYKRQSGKHFNPYVFDDIKTIADHVHWVGDNGPHAGNFRSSSAGGGHAHAGAVIYQGAEHWPEEFRNTIFMNNIHGYRVNADVLERQGSGYTASHGKDFLKTNDSWSQWLDYRYGPGGSMYAIDWYDKNQCHSANPDVHDKTLGRIYKISHEKDEFVQVDLSEKSDLELVEYQLHPNEWYVRQSRQILQSRGGSEEVYTALKKILEENPHITRKLRALWALHVTGGMAKSDYLTLLDHEDEFIRSWALELYDENYDFAEEELNKLAMMARDDESAMVRLYICSAMEGIALEDRWTIVKELNNHSVDSDDHNLPLMNWYVFEPLIEEDMDRAMELALESEIPEILQFTIKKLGMLENSHAKEVLEKANAQIKTRASLEKFQEAGHELEMLLSHAE